jgi:saccharopine dehydrogenase-like NADP-dependent oxidoreductase
MNTVLSQGPFGLEPYSMQAPTTSPSALGRGQRVAVVGGDGFYSRYPVADLLRFTGAQVLVASRRAPQRLRPTDRVVPVACDLRDPRALRGAIRGSAVVVHCAGPFQHLPLEPLQAAIATGVHYVDISEDRAYRQRALAMDTEARAAGIVVLNGASVVPGMQALVTELLRPRFDELLAVCGSAAPDTRRHRGHAMFHTMLLGAGRPFQAPRKGLPVRVYGWREPEWFDFPPTGRSPAPLPGPGDGGPGRAAGAVRCRHRYVQGWLRVPTPQPAARRGRVAADPHRPPSAGGLHAA